MAKLVIGTLEEGSIMVNNYPTLEKAFDELLKAAGELAKIGHTIIWNENRRAFRYTKPGDKYSYYMAVIDDDDDDSLSSSIAWPGRAQEEQS